MDIVRMLNSFLFQDELRAHEGIWKMLRRHLRTHRHDIERLVIRLNVFKLLLTVILRNKKHGMFVR